MSTETGDLAPAIEAPVDGQAPEVQQPQAAQPTVQEPATETAQPAPPPSKTQQPAAKGAKPAKGDDTVGGEKKLSGAELKKLQKAEKAARRASQKAAQASQAPGQAGVPGAQADGKGAQNKQKQGGGAPGQQGGQQKAQHAKQATATALPVIPKEVKPAIPEIFSHLSMARRISIIQADKDVNPAVLVLGQYMSTFALTDSITRLETTLYAFKKVGPIACSTRPLLLWGGTQPTSANRRANLGHRFVHDSSRHNFLQALHISRA
jgi:translation initiation factor eIF-2B subunit delta